MVYTGLLPSISYSVVCCEMLQKGQGTVEVRAHELLEHRALLVSKRQQKTLHTACLHLQ